MNKLEENKQNFCIDKNKQDIRRLEKMNRSQSEDIASLNQFKTKTNTDLSKIQTDLSAAKSDIEELKSAASSTGEKIELMSYDCYKTNERIYRDTCWLPRPIAFCAESGKMFKFRVKFNAVSTFETAITSTATISFDGEQIFSDTQQIPAGGTHAVDFEHSTSSERGGHKLVIELRNTETASRRTNCCIPDFLTVELWGTNVQFVTRNNDFSVIPAGDKVVMTTTVFDNPNAMFSMQTTDENLSFEESAFKYLRTNDYRDYNQVVPHINVVFDEEKNLTYSTNPSIMVYNIQTDETEPRIAYYLNVTGNNSKAMNPTGIVTTEGFHAKSLMTNSYNVATVNPIADMMAIMNNGWIITKNRGVSLSIIREDDEDRPENVEGCGVVRLDNVEDKVTYYGIGTRQNGTSYFWSKQVKKNISISQKLELGFGTHSNAYLMANNQIHVFLRVGKNIKKFILKEEVADNDYHFYELVSTSIIPNCQEFWLAPNGTHFERVGNKIYYYAQNQSTPTKTLQMFC